MDFQIQSIWQIKRTRIRKYQRRTLAEARKQRDRTRVMIFKGLDPIIEKQKKLLQLKRSLNQTFGWAANEYINTMEIQWKN